MPDNDNTPEIEILPPEPGHRAGQGTEDGYGPEAPFTARPVPGPWQVIALRILRALLMAGIVVGAFFVGTIVLGVVILLLIGFGLWGFWMRATGRHPNMHFRRW